jgi:hypothetical protein
MPVRDRCGTDPSRRSTGPARGPTGVAPRRCRVAWGLRAEGALSTMTSWTVPREAEVSWYGAEETSNPETLALQGSQGDRRCRAAGGWEVERTASGHLKVIGPAGSAIVASAPNTGRAGGRAVHNTLATIRSKTGLQV